MPVSGCNNGLHLYGTFMKANSSKQQIKKAIALIALSLVTASSPLMAQSSSSSGGSAGRSDQGAASVQEPAGADYSSHNNWSWIGLLGLLGLFGLRHRSTVDNDDANLRRTRPAV
jgi:hypothetical protein